MARARSPPSRSATCSAWPTAARIRRLLETDPGRRRAGDAGRSSTRHIRSRRRAVGAAPRPAGGGPRQSPAPRSAASRRSGSSRPRSARPLPTGRRGSAGAAIHRLWQLLLKGLDDVHDRARSRTRRPTMALLRADPRRRSARSAALCSQMLASGEAAVAPLGAERRSADQSRAAQPAGRFRGSGRRARAQGKQHARACSCTIMSAWSASRRRELVLKPLKPLGADFVARARRGAQGRRPAHSWQVRLTDEGGAALAPAAGGDGRGRLRRRCSTRRWSRRCSRPFPTPSWKATRPTTTECLTCPISTKS